MNIRANANFRPGNVAAAMDHITTRAINATTKATNRILDTALSLVPVDTGELKSSGKATVVWSGTIVKGRVEFTAGHAAFAEFGVGQRGSAGQWAGPYPYSSKINGYAGFGYLRGALYQNRESTMGDFRDAGFKV